MWNDTVSLLFCSMPESRNSELYKKIPSKLRELKTRPLDSKLLALKRSPMDIALTPEYLRQKWLELEHGTFISIHSEMLNHQLVFQSFGNAALRYIAVLLSHMHLLYCFHIDCKIFMSYRNTERRESALSTFRLLRHICNYASRCTFQCIYSKFPTKSTSLAGLFLFWI